MVKTAGYSTRVATDAPHGGTIYSSPHDFTVAMYDYTASAAWVTATPYVVGDLVKSHSAGYRCIADHTSAATDEPGAAAGVNWATYWELLGANVLLLSALHAKLTGMDISWFSRVLVYPSGHSPALPYQPIEDPKMRWDDTNKLLWIPDDVEVADVICVEIRGPSRMDLVFGNVEVQVEANPDEVGEKASSIILASTLGQVLPTGASPQPAVYPIMINHKGAMRLVGYLADGDLIRQGVLPVEIAGRYSSAAAYDFLTTALAGTNNDLTWTAVEPGTSGLSIEYVDGGVGVALSISINAAGKITVTFDLAANLTTAKMVADASRADARIASVVRVENAVGNDGSGKIAVLAVTPFAGGAGLARAKAIAVDANGNTLAYLVSTLNEVNDKVRNRPLAPAEVVAHGVWIPSGTVGNTTRLTTTSVDCSLVVILPDPYAPAPGGAVANEFFWAGFSYTSGNLSILTAAALVVAGDHRAIKAYNVDSAVGGNGLRNYLCQACAVPIADPSLIYGAASVAGDGPGHRQFAWIAYGEGHV